MKKKVGGEKSKAETQEEKTRVRRKFGDTNRHGTTFISLSSSVLLFTQETQNPERGPSLSWALRRPWLAAEEKTAKEPVKETLGKGKRAWQEGPRLCLQPPRTTLSEVRAKTQAFKAPATVA